MADQPIADIIEIEQLLVRYVGLGEQDVHVARHPSGDGMDRVVHRDARGLE